MKNITGSLCVFAAMASFAFAGTEYTGGKEMRQTAVQEECWYGDTELNVSLWGTYAFAGTDQGHIGAPGFFLGDDLGDRYLQADHAWGGGLDIKYFWHKYFGFGIEGFGLDAKRTEFSFTGAPPPAAFAFSKTDDSRLIGAALGTLTLRYPIGCSRFAPYVFGGFGGIFNGGEKDNIVVTGGAPAFVTTHSDSESKIMG